MRRGSLVWRVVLLVVAHPGLLDVEDIARRLCEFPSWEARPCNSWAELEAQRDEKALWVAQCNVLVAEMVPRVRNALKGARRAGLLMPATHCRVDRHTAQVVGRRGVGVVRDFSWSTDAYRDSHRCITDGPKLTGHAKRIVEALVEGPLRPSELRARTGGLTPQGNERGAWRRAWERLVRDGAVVPPTVAWPTLKGQMRAARLGVRHPLRGLTVGPPSKLNAVRAV